MTTAGVTYPAQVRLKTPTSVKPASPPFFTEVLRTRHREGFRCKGILGSAYWEAADSVFPTQIPPWCLEPHSLKQPAAARTQETSGPGHRGTELGA